MSPIHHRLILSITTVLFISGCGDSHADSASQKPPRAIVTAGAPLEQPVRDYVDFTGRTDAVDSVEIRARVTGFLKEVFFDADLSSADKKRPETAEGTELKQGTPLYQIDDREFQADLKSAEAELEIAQAQRDKAASDVKRAHTLKEKGSISAEEIERIDTAKKQADGNVAEAEAKRDRAALDVEFSHIVAPITGRISQSEVSAGNLIRANITLLTTIVSVDPIYVHFDLDERTMLRLRNLMREGKVKSGRTPGSDDKETYSVELGLAIDQGYPKSGYIDFVDNRVNPATGTIRVRGVFENPEFKPQRREMAPGLFARVRVPLSEPHPALLVAERCIGTDQGRKFVYILNEKDEVVDRTVALGPQQNGLRVITEGLKGGERVIIDGMQRVRPGSEVTAKPARMDGRPGETLEDEKVAQAGSKHQVDTATSSAKQTAE